MIPFEQRRAGKNRLDLWVYSLFVLHAEFCRPIREVGQVLLDGFLDVRADLRVCHTVAAREKHAQFLDGHGAMHV